MSSTVDDLPSRSLSTFELPSAKLTSAGDLHGSNSSCRAGSLPLSRLILNFLLRCCSFADNGSTDMHIRCMAGCCCLLSVASGR